MRVSRAGAWKWTMVLGALLLGGFACNDHELNPFSASVRSAAVDRTEQGEVRPVDILFVVDSSNSMCEEQAILEENFEEFIGILAEANADFHLAVITTDMVNLTGRGLGLFQTSPGTYQNVSSCTISVPDTSNCPASVGPILTAAQYRDAATGELNVAQLQADFRCMALTGIDGSPVEMGLEAMEAALRDAGQAQAFLRPNALLSIVFVTDENDCSDGTNGGQHGPVYSEVAAGAGDTACEYSRNAEDACLYAAGDTLTIDPMTGRATLERNTGSPIQHDGNELPAREWCVQGDREAINAIAGQLDLKCEGGGAACGNALTPRREYYSFLLDLVAQKNYGELYNGDDEDREDALTAAANDVIIATIINTDGGQRYNSNEQVTPWCGVGQQSYRYQAFAEMFPQERRVIAPICDLTTGNPTDFAPSLTLIAETIGKAINSLCLQSYPMQCTSDADCPQGQTCDLANPYLAANPTYTYSTCSGFTVRVEEITSFDENGDPLTTNLLQEGVDYTINREATNCLPASPLEVSFARAPATGAQLVISYPRAVSSVF